MRCGCHFINLCKGRGEKGINSRPDHVAIDGQVKNAAVQTVLDDATHLRYQNCRKDEMKSKKSETKGKNRQLSRNKTKIKYTFKWIFNSLEWQRLFVVVLTLFPLSYIAPVHSDVLHFASFLRSMSHPKLQWIVSAFHFFFLQLTFFSLCVSGSVSVCPCASVRILYLCPWTHWNNNGNELNFLALSSQCSTHIVFVTELLLCHFIVDFSLLPVLSLLLAFRTTIFLRSLWELIWRQTIFPFSSSLFYSER